MKYSTRRQPGPVRRLSRTKVVLPKNVFNRPKKGLSFRLCVQAFFLFVCLLVSLICYNQYGRVDDSHLGSVRNPYGMRERRRTKVGKRGTAIVAACQDMHEELRHAMKSWVSVKGVNEIVVVDWGSEIPLQFVVEEMDRMGHDAPFVSVVHVDNGGEWNPSAAYNLAFRYTDNRKVLRVDCDHHIDPLFAARHSVSGKTFLTGSEDLARSDDEDHLQEVLYAERKVLFQAGGYDERLQEFGGEHEDLVRRLRALGLKRTYINYDGLSHSFHHADHGEEEYNLSDEIRDAEKEVNLRLLKRVEPWNQVSSLSSSSLVAGDITIDSFRHANVQYLTVNLSRPGSTPSIRKLVPQEQVCKKREAALGKLLQERYKVPSCVIEILDCNGRSDMANAFSSRSAEHSLTHSAVALFLFCVGSLPERLRLLSSGLSLTRQTGRLPFIFWLPVDDDGFSKFVSYHDLFTGGTDAVVFEMFKEQKSDTRTCKSTSLSHAGTMRVYNFTANDRRPVVEHDPVEHILLQSVVPVNSTNLRHMNEKNDRLALLNLTLHLDIEADLKELEIKGLRDSIGMYIPRSSSRGRDSIALEYMTAIEGKMREMGGNNLRDQAIYIDSDAMFQERLQNMSAQVLSPPPSTDGCRHDLCFKNDLARIMALVRAGSFFTLEDNKFSRFVRFLRGERTLS